MSETLDINGVTRSGDLAETIHLHGSDGMTASIFTLGARVLDLRLPNGRPVVLSFDDLDQIEADDAFVNVAVGRVCNRIKNGQITRYPEMTDITLELNDNNVNHLHGGSNSWDKQLYSVQHLTDSGVTLVRFSPHGEQRHPSAVNASITYELTGDGGFLVIFKTTNSGDRLTQTNVTLHPYFDLTGRNGTVRNSVLPYTIHAPACNKYLVLDETNAPTGEIADVKDTRFDFTTERPISEDESTFEGYDQFLVSSEPIVEEMVQNPMLKIVAPSGEWGCGVQLDVLTNQPGVQIYTANGMNGSSPQGFDKYGSLAIEPSEFVDAGNHDNFPPCALKPAESRRQIITYKFTLLE